MDRTVNPGIGATLMAPAELQEGIARLSRGTYFKEASLEVTLGILTESAAQMSGIARVSIWALCNAQKELRCLDLYELSSASHQGGMSLHARDYPRYFQALRSEDCIAADDAHHYPATCEFSSGYLSAHAITAMLDTPIHIRGSLEGVLCLEQVGTQQPWTTMHRLFAHTVANLVTLALVEYEADEARRQAAIADQRLQAMLKNMPDLAVDRNGLLAQAS